MNICLLHTTFQWTLLVIYQFVKYYGCYGGNRKEYQHDIPNWMTPPFLYRWSRCCPDQSHTWAPPTFHFPPLLMQTSGASLQVPNKKIIFHSTCKRCLNLLIQFSVFSSSTVKYKVSLAEREQCMYNTSQAVQTLLSWRNNKPLFQLKLEGKSCELGLHC